MSNEFGLNRGNAFSNTKFDKIRAPKKLPPNILGGEGSQRVQASWRQGRNNSQFFLADKTKVFPLIPLFKPLVGLWAGPFRANDGGSVMSVIGVMTLCEISKSTQRTLPKINNPRISLFLTSPGLWIKKFENTESPEKSHKTAWLFPETIPNLYFDPSRAMCARAEAVVENILNQFTYSP